MELCFNVRTFFSTVYPFRSFLSLTFYTMEETVSRQFILSDERKSRKVFRLPLSGLHFFGTALFLCKKYFYVSLCTKKFLHFFFRFAIVRVACFLFCQQLGIFRVQLLDLGEFFQVSFIKRRFRCLVQGDLRAVRFQKALAVSGLEVGIIDWSRA